MGRIIVEQILKIFWIFPIKQDRVVFRSSQGTKYNCNPKYISEYLRKYFPDKFELVWVFDNPEKYKFLENMEIKVYGEKSLKGLFHIITAKFLIDNHGIQSYIPVRKGQEVINTWHGGGSYKKSYANHSKKHIKYLEKMNRETTVFLSSCERFSNCNLRTIKESHPEKIMDSGLPRNDIFFRNNSEIALRVKQALGISTEKKLVLYAPTFRDDVTDENYKIDMETLLTAYKKRFGGDFVFAIRYHRFTKSNGENIWTSDVVDANGFEDMQELIYASDIMISDYSSCIWDASLAYKPCFIYAMDLPKYLKNRNFYTPITDWPFPLAESIDELVDNIEHFDDEAYRKKVNEHYIDLGSYEQGSACEIVAKYMISKL